jgi:hypothetical protein
MASSMDGFELAASQEVVESEEESLKTAPPALTTTPALVTSAVDSASTELAAGR